MEVFFDVGGFSESQKSEIDAVFKRVEEGGMEGCWMKLPDSIHIRARLKEGRSASEVLQVEVRSGAHRTPMVAKVGPLHELQREWEAFRKFLATSSALFAPIRVATPAVLGKTAAVQGRKEAVFYDHAARYAGQPDRVPETLEAVARLAIREGGRALERTERSIQQVFAGIRNDLYEKFAFAEGETTAIAAWNLKLGVALEIVADCFHAGTETFFTHSGEGGKAEHKWPRDLVQAAAEHDSELEPGTYVQIDDLEVEWRGARLMGLCTKNSLRLEVLTDDGRTARNMAALLAGGGKFSVQGWVRSLRARSHRAKLDAGLPEWVNARLADPFAALPRLLTEERRSNRLTALVHGDLNPRNVLLVEDSPLLIDYAYTAAGEPFFLDFTRLEGCLARDILPNDLSLEQHIRLQRLLAAACRLGQRGADRFAQKLGAERAELGAAFRIFWAIRKAARDIYQSLPGSLEGPWYRDYFEQLFFFAHLSLKWEEQTSAALSATAAMAGVAAESLSGVDLYRHWPAGDLRIDGLEILELATPRDALPDLAAIARALARMREEADKELHSAFEKLRADFVRATFEVEAKSILADLEKDHKVYISLHAYIDLRGRLHRGRNRQKLSFEQMHERDEMLGAVEDLRASGGLGGKNPVKDVLQLLAEHEAVVLLGDAGGGKSTAAREWQYRLAAVVAGREQGIAPRLPLFYRAPNLWQLIGDASDSRPSISAVLGRAPELLEAGAIHLTVDALNELPEEQVQRVASFLIALRDHFPATWVVACHRLYNYTPGLLPFPAVGLEKVEQEQARRYVFDYLQANGVVDWYALGERLVKLLLDDPEHAQVRDLAQTPLFLWMLVERYRQTQVAPSGRGRLFADFSRWYLEEKHHHEHQEPVVPARFSFEAKAEFLGRLGYTLVDSRATDIELAVVEGWLGVEMLPEILASELLMAEDGKLRFLHQSFQEYFAARHFLGGEAKDPVALNRKVHTLGWHDAFEVLVGFGDEAPEVVEEVVKAALEVNPVLAARCLRMAEAPIEALLERFVEVQARVLRDPAEGGHGRERAVRALAEHGRGRARAELLCLAADSGTPSEARVAILRILPALPSQARFEPVRPKILQELQELLSCIFQEAVDEVVLQAAIEAAAAAGLNQLGMFLRDFVEPEKPWPLCRAAWQALAELKFSPSLSLRDAYLRACADRLEWTEQALFNESTQPRMDDLNTERLAILEALATPGHLPLLLQRRFCHRIHERVKVLLDRLIATNGQVSAEGQEAWQILREAQDPEAVQRWQLLVIQGSGLAQLAAGHRLMAALGSGGYSGEGLRPILEAKVNAGRIAIVSELATARAHWLSTKEIEAFSFGLIQKVKGKPEADAYTRLVEALMTRDPAAGRRMAAMADLSFWLHRANETECIRYPWWQFILALEYTAGDFDSLLGRGGDFARAAVLAMASSAGFALSRAGHDWLCFEPQVSSLNSLHWIATVENEPVWQRYLALAAAKINATSLLGWILSWSRGARLASSVVTVVDSEHGTYFESGLADVLRVIGHLTRSLRDAGRLEEAGEAATCLNWHASRLPETNDRSIVVGCTTALGFLGKWEPILSHLGPGEPWMHEAALNTFDFWVSKLPAERERAARWIYRRLRQHQLEPAVRSTLGGLLEALEREIGRHISGEADEKKS